MKKSFDTLANRYALLEWIVFGSILQKARQFSLTAIEANRPIKALVLGDGDGRFSKYALSQRPLLTIDSLDASIQMLKKANVLISSADSIEEHRYRQIHINALQYSYPMSEYDIVICHFFLDCFIERNASDLLLKIEKSLKPGGFFLYSDFNDSCLLHQLAIWILYRFFRLTTDIEATQLPRLKLPESLALVSRRTWISGLVVSESWQKRSVSATR